MANRYSSKHSSSQPQSLSYNGNTLMDWETYQKSRREAAEQAAEILSLDPSGIITAQKIAVKTWWRNKLHGSIYLMGLIAFPIVTLGFTFHAIRASLFPAPIAQESKLEHRVGNATGRALNTTWKGLKPGIAAVEVQLRQGETSPTRATEVNTSEPDPLVLTRSSSRLVEVTDKGAAHTASATELDPVVEQAIEQFLK
ncbi:hypothetical protein [Lusitaniella coriacea]|uniref:hypothetical protein n=1 Tax=Lusitaniella coriacea TaxID=1983105 RepID=UPI003CEBBDF2